MHGFFNPFASGSSIDLVKIKGETTTPLTDGSTTNPIVINGESYTAEENDAVFYDKKEYVFDGLRWHEFGYDKNEIEITNNGV